MVPQLFLEMESTEIVPPLNGWGAITREMRGSFSYLCDDTRLCKVECTRISAVHKLENRLDPSGALALAQRQPSRVGWNVAGMTEWYLHLTNWTKHTQFPVPRSIFPSRYPYPSFPTYRAHVRCKIIY